MIHFNKEHSDMKKALKFMVTASKISSICVIKNPIKELCDSGKSHGFVKLAVSLAKRKDAKNSGPALYKCCQWS